MKDLYELKGTPRKNPYAERMKSGYRIVIDRGSEDEDSSADKKINTSDKNLANNHYASTQCSA
ncbi:MAG: hypothetical protein FWB80_06600 [Defluviitaleaceae bacterium]|nr:hypothetical protein [Defluviitaleaceae bacterium]